MFLVSLPAGRVHPGSIDSGTPSRAEQCSIRVGNGGKLLGDPNQKAGIVKTLGADMKPYPYQEIEISNEEIAEEPLDYMKMTQDWVTKMMNSDEPTPQECLDALRKDEVKIRIPVIDYERADWEPVDEPTPGWPRWLAFSALVIIIIVALTK